MRRRQVLLGTTVMVTGFAGCNSSRSGNEMDTSTNESTDRTTASETAPASETPPDEFTQEWLFDREDDWTERRRVTEYPDSDEAVDWTPHYARSAEYAHVPSRDELKSATDASDVPPVGCAVLSKWALPAEFSNTPVGLVARVREWFESRFEECLVNEVSPIWVEPSKSELESGRTIGSDDYDADGDTGRLEATLPVTVDGESVDVERMTYDAEAHLYSLLGPKKRIGYLAGGAWPATDAVTLHTVENGEIDVSATVSGESWGLEERLVDVLENIDQRRS